MLSAWASLSSDPSMSSWMGCLTEGVLSPGVESDVGRGESGFEFAGSDGSCLEYPLYFPEG